MTLQLPYIVHYYSYKPSIPNLKIIKEMSADNERVKDMIESDKLVIFSKSFCPYCDDVKKLCDRLHKPFTSYELDQLEDGVEIQTALEDITGAKTVPRIFVEGNCLGGASDFQDLYTSGDIYGILKVKKIGWFSNMKNRLRQMFISS